MTHRPAASPTYPIVELLKQRWTLLVAFEIHNGAGRFTTIRRKLGIAPDVLASRLVTLVEMGIVSKQAYRTPGHRNRELYVPSHNSGDLDALFEAVGLCLGPTNGRASDLGGFTPPADSEPH